MLALEQIRRFYTESTIHGVQYLAPDRSLCTRILWLCLMVLAIILASLVVLSLLENWQQNPIVTTIETTNYPVQKIPFPAITVCVNQHDPWAFFQRLGNAIDYYDKDFQADFNEVFLPFWQSLTVAIQTNISIKVHWKDALNAFLERCQKAVHAYPCLTARMLYYFLKRNFLSGRDVLLNLVKELSVSYFLGGAMSPSRLVEMGAYPLLKQAMIDQNITADCEECFKWERIGSPGVLNFFAVSRYSREIGDLIAPDNKTAAENKEIIKIMYELLMQLEHLTRTKISFLGNFLVMRYISGDHRQTRNEYFANILGKFDDIKIKNASMIGPMLVSLTTFTQNRFLEVMDSKLAFHCNPSDTDHPMGCNQGSYQGLLTIMKESIFRPHMFDLDYLFESNFTGDLNEIEPSFPSYVTGNLTGYKIKSKVSHQLTSVIEPLIPFCMLANRWSNPPKWGSIKWGSTEGFTYQSFKEFCTLFRPSITDQGICYSFNQGQPPEKVFQPSSYMNAYKKVFGLPRNDVRETFKAKGIGLQNGIRLVLDAHTLTGNFKWLPRRDNTFKLSIQHPEDFPMPMNEGIDIKGGYATSIIVTPQRLQASKSTSSLPVEKRGCKFFHEKNTLSLFKKYSHKACLFECMYEGAKEMANNCVPWNYPTFNSFHNDTCDTLGNVYFTHQMRNGTRFESCNCPIDCVQTTYTYFTNLQELKPSDCDSNDKTFDKIKTYIETHKTDELMQEWWLQNKDPRADCSAIFQLQREIGQRYRIVDVYYGSQFATKLNKGLTATFTDKLASIGGTLGLFCGISILSLVEVLLCLSRTCFRGKRK